jgi:hypothetical protein
LTPQDRNPRRMQEAQTELQLVPASGNNQPRSRQGPEIISVAPLVLSHVYDTYWKFASERQAIFFRRVSGAPPPWTNDPILQQHKFTNAYRASDRVSQYLIRNVIYSGDPAIGEVFFRIMLFKLFNKIETWQLLQRSVGELRWDEFSYERYDRALTQAIESGKRIYSAAYIMPSGGVFGHTRKHRNHLDLIQLLMRDNVPERLQATNSMKEGFNLLRSYPTLGDFLAYQLITDINYSELTDFSETEFVIPGPGARDGIRKCFIDLGDRSESDVIRIMADRQADEFARLGLEFRSLWGRPLQLIDCQNLFCEVDKYARVAHPEVQGRTGRTRIKQKYRPTLGPIPYWYPPKWGLNEVIERSAWRGA